jgi:long-subunit fatty acid transport protein
MRKLFTLIIGTMIAGSLLAGGLVTNTNQSAAWVRLPARNASTEIDAAYYNPAGLMKMNNGLHLSLSNQSIWQTREVTSDYPYLNNGVYKGTVKAPLFPSVYAAYKMDKLAIFAGFNPIGGGGGATYEDGLPSFEMSQSDLVPMLSGAPFTATAYRMDVFFKGSSTFLGFQGGLAYKINDFISIAAGLRYVTAKNTYEGYLKDVQVNIASGWTDASVILDGISATASTSAANLQAAITGGLVGADDPISASVRAGLISLGIDPTGFTNAIAVGAFTAASTKYALNANLLEDQEADVTQTGSGITPFFSVNITPIENLNIAVKYEMATKLELQNETATDLLIGYTATGTSITMFPNGEKLRNDMPALLTVGAELQLSKLKLALGGNYYFDKSADYGHKIDHDIDGTTPTIHIDNSEIIDKNGMLVSAGLEYKLSDLLLVSGGYSYANKGVNSKYQSDLTYGLATHTFGIGGAVSLTDMIRINVGASYTAYMEDSKEVNHKLGAINMLPEETYKKKTMLIGVGVDFSF